MLEWQNKQAEQAEQATEKNNNSIETIKNEYSDNQTSSVKFPLSNNFNRNSNSTNANRLLMIAPFREQAIKHKLIKMEICDENPNAFLDDNNIACLKTFQNGSIDNGSDNHRSFPTVMNSPPFKSATLPIKLENGLSNKLVGVPTTIGLVEPTGKPFLKHAPFDKVTGAEVRMCTPVNEENQLNNNRFYGEKPPSRLAAKVAKAPRRRKKN